MNQKIKDYLNVQRVGVITTMMSDTQPHTATVHCCFDGDSFLVMTSRDSRKVQLLNKSASCLGSFVVGTTEPTDGDDQITFQADGQVSIVYPDECGAYWRKFPDKFEKYGDHLDSEVFLKLTPTWWRFTRWSAEGKEIISSKD